MSLARDSKHPSSNDNESKYLLIVLLFPQVFRLPAPRFTGVGNMELSLRYVALL